MIDVFVCTTGRGRRNDLARRVSDTWADYELFGVQVLFPEGEDDASVREFNRERRIRARQRSKGDALAYVLSDDDVVPTLADGEDIAGWVQRGVAALLSTPELAILCPTLTNETIYPSDDPIPGRPDIMCCTSVGTLRFVRKAAVQGEMPPIVLPNGGYDITEGEWLRAKGWKLGYLKGLDAVHIGHGRSELSAEWSGAANA